MEPLKKYEVDDTDERGYPESWSKYPSVTEVLDIIRKEELERWLKHTTAEEISGKMEKAQEIGTIANEVIDMIDSGEKKEFDTQYPTEVYNAVKSYMMWKKDTGAIHIESQVRMVDEELGFKGTLDKVVRIGDKIVLIELKTSRKIYKEYLLQAVAYMNLYSPTNVVDEVRIVRLEKNSVGYEERIIQPLGVTRLWIMFRNLLAFYSDWKSRESRMNCLCEKGESNGR